VQPKKALLPLEFPKLVTDEGITILVKLVQKLKLVMSLIDALLFESNKNNILLIRLEIFLKAPLLILVTVDGIITTGGPLFALYEAPVTLLSEICKVIPVLIILL
jgi:hypothetical protein